MHPYRSVCVSQGSRRSVEDRIYHLAFPVKSRRPGRAVFTSPIVAELSVSQIHAQCQILTDPA
jgi:hypothetical protein